MAGLAMPVSGGSAPLLDMPLPAAPPPAALAPELGCGAPEAAPVALRPGLARSGLVRAERPAPRRPRAAAPRPEAVEDPPAVLLRAFYTCAAGHWTSSRLGPAGWVSVGPLRRT
jgi:hypothetical protein